MACEFQCVTAYVIKKEVWIWCLLAGGLMEKISLINASTFSPYRSHKWIISNARRKPWIIHKFVDVAFCQWFYSLFIDSGHFNSQTGELLLIINVVYSRRTFPSGHLRLCLRPVLSFIHCAKNLDRIKRTTTTARLECVIRISNRPQHSSKISIFSEC